MKKQEFLVEIKEILLLDNISESTVIEFDSLGSLMLIALLDENFSISINQEQIKLMERVKDLISFIGENNFN